MGVPPSPQPPPRIPVCGIGASAGGVDALQQFFRALPPDLGLAYIVVVHLSPDHKSELPAILARWTTMPVFQAARNGGPPVATFLARRAAGRRGDRVSPRVNP
jgi:chemotaxis response regulator CheB